MFVGDRIDLFNQSALFTLFHDLLNKNWLRDNASSSFNANLTHRAPCVNPLCFITLEK